MIDKQLKYSDLKKYRKDHISETICFTNGCFDIIHIGHIRCLREAKKQGDILVVGLNSDSSIKKLKGNERPINHQTERAEVLAAFSFVDAIIIFDEDTPVNIIEELRPNVWIKGGDYSPESLPGSELAKKLNIKMFFVPLIPGKSTTKIINSTVVNDQRKRVTVIGDTALDFSYFIRQSDEKSAETGIPVKYVEKTQYDAGGGGNLAIDLAVFEDLRVSLCGFCGDDLWARLLKNKLEECNVDCSALIECENQSTYVYHRIFDENYEEEPRFDVRPTREYTEDEEDILLKSIEKQLEKCDMIIINQQLSISVHSERFAMKLSEMLKMVNLPIWVDYRGLPPYLNCSYKINLKECREIAGSDEIEACIRELYRRMVKGDAEHKNYVVVTLGENGAIAYNGAEYYRVDGIETNFEKDTVGAGDAFLAALCRSLLKGKTFEKSLQYANAAGTASTKYLYMCGHPNEAEIEDLMK